MPSLSVLSAKLPQTLLNYYCPQTKFAKVTFLQLSVSHSVHSGGLQAHTQGGKLGGWAGGSPGPHLGESQGPDPGGVCLSVCCDPPPPQHTATAAGGTHPTGMHSCLIGFFHNTHLIR